MSMSKKVFIGPLDTGLNGALKKILSSRYQVTTCNFVSSAFVDPSDINLDIDKTNKVQATGRVLANFIKSLNFNIYHFRFGQSLLPYNIDLPFLKILGKKIIMTFDGDDLRQVDRLPEDKSGRILAARYRKILKLPRKDLTRRWRYAWIKLWADKITVTTPDLLVFAPEAEYVPVFAPRLTGTDHLTHHSSKVAVLHAPTDAGIKGTKYIEAAIKKLGAPFVLKIARSIPKSKMLAAYQEADIVIDQLLIGAFGFVSVEAMAAGKPVICFIRDEVKKYYPKDLPVINASIDNLKNVLLSLKDYRVRQKVGAASQRFVQKNLSQEILGKRWLKIYQKL